MATIKKSPILKGAMPTNAHPGKVDPTAGGMPSIMPGVGSHSGGIPSAPGVPAQKATSLPSIGGVAEGNPAVAAKAPAPKVVAKPPKAGGIKIAIKTNKPVMKATKSAFTPAKPRKGY